MLRVLTGRAGIRWFGAAAAVAVEHTAGPITPATAVVAPQWLASHLKEVTVLDASWYMPAEKRNTKEEFGKERIPGAAFFDLDAISDPSSGLPHMLPTAQVFGEHMARLGVSHNRPVVVYDTAGIFSAARLWWTLKLFGHKQVAVLNGGLPGWKEAGLPVETTPADAASMLTRPPIVPVEPWALSRDGVWSLEQVLAAPGTTSSSEPLPTQPLVVDARSLARFSGEAADPRAALGVRSGHIPGSTCVPFTALLDTKKQRLLPASQLQAVFKLAHADHARPGPTVVSCGSGVTACVLALGLAALGRDPAAIKLYDGSWAEYGGKHTAPVETGHGYSDLPKHLQ